MRGMAAGLSLSKNLWSTYHDPDSRDTAKIKADDLDFPSHGGIDTHSSSPPTTTSK